MDENRVAGTVRNVGGKVEEDFGRVTGNTRAQTEGLVDQAAGAAQDLYGQARDTAANAVGLPKILPPRLRSGCVALSRRSPIRPPSSALASAGCSVECTDLCDLEARVGTRKPYTGKARIGAVRKRSQR